MAHFIGEANLQTLNFNLLLRKRAGDWSKDPWLFMWRLIFPALVQSKKSYFKLLCFSLESETAMRSKNHIWPRWLFSVLKTQTQSSSALGEEVKGEEKTKQNKQNWIFNPCFSSMTTSGISQVAYAICFYSAVHLLNQQERYSRHPLPQSLL